MKRLWTETLYSTHICSSQVRTPKAPQGPLIWPSVPQAICDPAHLWALVSDCWEACEKQVPVSNKACFILKCSCCMLSVSLLIFLTFGFFRPKRLIWNLRWTLHFCFNCVQNLLPVCKYIIIKKKEFHFISQMFKSNNLLKLLFNVTLNTSPAETFPACLSDQYVM